MGDAAAIHMQLAQGGARVEGANEGGDAVAADARVAREAQLVDAVWLRAERLREERRRPEFEPVADGHIAAYRAAEAKELERAVRRGESLGNLRQALVAKPIDSLPYLLGTLGVVGLGLLGLSLYLRKREGGVAAALTAWPAGGMAASRCTTRSCRTRTRRA